MTTVTRPTTGLIPQSLARMLLLRRSRGTARTVYSIVRKVTTLPIVRRCTYFCASDLYRLQLSKATSPTRTPKSFVVRQATGDDLPALADYFGDRALVETRLERGDVCVITLCQDKVGAAVWLTVGPGEYHDDWDDLRCVCRLPAHVAWTYDGRGTKLGAWGTLMAKLPDLLQEHGVTELDTLIDCNGWKSLDSHKSLSYENIGTIARFGAFGLMQSVCKPRRGKWRFLPTRLGEIEFAGRRGV